MPELHPSLAGRWSPRGFDAGHRVARAELASLLEAARWAPSADNSQPWRFVIGRRDDTPHKLIFDCLGADEQRWAWRASALVVTAFLVPAAEPTCAALVRAAYDLGHAVAHLGVQATTLRLHTRQIVDFDPDRLRGALELHHTVVLPAVVAIGRLGDPATLPSDLRKREFRLRERRPVEQLLLASAL